MEEGYYWIIKNQFSYTEIAKYDAKRELFFTIGSTYGLTLSDIDYKEKLCESKTPTSEKEPALPLKRISFSETEVCQLKQSEYLRGVEDGKIIAEHGTVNWQT